MKKTGGDGRSRAASGARGDLTWVPSDLSADMPPYLAVVEALRIDVQKGVLAPGTQLPPHRTLANQLGLSLSTITKAYREASAHGLVVGHVGQGTFVAPPASVIPASRPSGYGSVDLGTNLSPDVGQREALRQAAAALMAEPGSASLFTHDWRHGFPAARAELAEWLACGAFRPSPDQIVATNGAQQGLALALALLCVPQDTILVEELTYVGFKALVSLHDLGLEPVPMDAEGMVPSELESALRRTGARVVYAMPTFQSPTARTMSAARRSAIAAVVERHDAYLIEDDVYGFLSDAGLEPIAAQIPTRTIHLSSFSKVFDLGFRAGMLTVPPQLAERARMALRATAWSATPMLFEVALRLRRSGSLDEIILNLRKENRRRISLLQAALPGAAHVDSRQSSYHVWLDLPGDWTPSSLFVAARDRGVTITPPGSASAAGVPETGIRLCLGAAAPAELNGALQALGGLLAQPIGAMFSIA